MEEKLITLRNYESMVDALFDQEVLRDNGIECALNNGDAVDLYPMFGKINDGLRILVFENDYEKALSILDEYKTLTTNEMH